MNETKVFIVDDHYMVIEGIRSLLQHAHGIDLVGHASNAASCQAFLHNVQPNVILMDINLPDKSGIDLCGEIKKEHAGIYILGLSTFNQESYIRKMMENGASGYVLKNASQQELLEAIHTVMKGKTYLSLEASEVLRNSSVKTGVPVLTRREKEVLSLIADGFTNAEIAEKLFVSTTTIDTHRTSLLSKLNAKNTASLVKLAMTLKLLE